MCNAAVIVEAIKSNKLVSLCKMCQCLGILKITVTRHVKCDSSHLTNNCNKHENVQPTVAKNKLQITEDVKDWGTPINERQ